MALLINPNDKSSKAAEFKKNYVQQKNNFFA